MTAVDALAGQSFFQLAFVVRDLESALARFSNVWNTGPWRLYTLGPENLSSLVYRGEPGRFAARIALNDQKPQLELIQPLAGPSIWEEWLDDRGETVHHVAVAVASLEEATQALAAEGIEPIQSGSGYGGDGEFAYFETVDQLGLVLEAVRPPTSIPEPDEVWRSG